MTSFIQRSFAGGELAAALYGRGDQAKYQVGLKTCRNFVVMRHGGVANRTGSQFIAEIKDSSSRIYFLKFVFNDDQTYLLEVGVGYIRFYRNGLALRVSGVPAWSAATAYIAGDLASRSGINYYCTFPHTNHQPPHPTYWWTLTEDIFEVPTDYAPIELANLKTVQSADVLTIVHPEAQPSELARFAETRWTWSPITFQPTIIPPTIPSVSSVVAGTTIWSYKVTSVKVETYEESVPTAAFSCVGGPPALELPNTCLWFPIPGATEYNVYREITPGNGIYGYIGTANAYDEAGVLRVNPGFNDPNITPDESATPPIPVDPFPGVLDKPGAVAYYQQRLVFARSLNKPETVWASRTGKFKNFTKSSPLQDDDAIEFTLNSQKVQEIRHLIEVGKLVILTKGGEWLVNGDPSGSLTPFAINAQQQSAGGASYVAPVLVGQSIVYVQERRNIVRALSFQVQPNGYALYAGNDLTIFAPHLFSGYTIDRLEFAQIPHSIIWAVRSDGTLLGLTYLPEEEVWGWHRHDTDGFYEDVCALPEGEEDSVYVLVRRIINGVTKRYIERFPSRRVTDVAIDALFLDSYLSYDGRNTTGTGMRLTSVSAVWTVDAEITVTASAAFFAAEDVGNVVVMYTGSSRVRVLIGTYVSATQVRGYPNKTVPVALRDVALSTWNRAVDGLAGLDHLEGKTVAILADGSVVTPQVVHSGSIALDRPYSVVHVGLPYVSEIETLDLDVPDQMVRGRQKRVSSVSLLVEASRGIRVGSRPDNLSEMAVTIPNYRKPIQLQTGLVTVPINPEWSETGRVFVRQEDPLPLTVLSAIPNLDLGG